MKKIGFLLLVLLILSGLATWFLFLNINYLTKVDLFGYPIENVPSGTLVLVSFILGGIVVWIISFIAYTVEITQLKSSLSKTKQVEEVKNKISDGNENEKQA